MGRRKYGQYIAGFDRQALIELGRLLAEVSKRRSEREQARASGNPGESPMASLIVSQDRLAQLLRSTWVHRLATKADLGFFACAVVHGGSPLVDRLRVDGASFGSVVALGGQPILAGGQQEIPRNWQGQGMACDHVREKFFARPVAMIAVSCSASLLSALLCGSARWQCNAAALVSKSMFGP